MVVDDSTYNIFVLEEIISSISEAIHIDTALNGQLAIDKVSQYVEQQEGNLNGTNQNPIKPYDYIFLDIHMPVLDGYQVSIRKVSTSLDSAKVERNGIRGSDRPLTNSSRRTFSNSS